MVKGQ